MRLRIWESRCRIRGVGQEVESRIYHEGPRVGSGFGVQGSGCRVPEPKQVQEVWGIRVWVLG